MIYEFRRYTLRPGHRDTLIELFERELLEPQEAAGMGVVGQFRDMDEPDVFCWMRKFPGMEARRAALTAFYGGPVWRAHRDAANATMIDSDDVLLLRPAFPGDPLPAARRPATGAIEAPEAWYVAHVWPVGPGFAGFFADRVAPALAAAGTPPVACFETEDAENTFPALPVRTGERVFVWLARFGGPAEAGTPEPPGVDAWLTAPPRRFRLSPTPRSALR
ncbi:NIPSNAP family protein [Nonomuraea sp. NPDC047897]|uniref:NIPSNAP family protein n=1 Tax=Nonomuraea sp. NPDC047897 TaxID=3364346 RepID=UPI00371BBF67